jgi:hypothetical protein
MENERMNNADKGAVMAKTAKKSEFKKITIPMPLKAVMAGGAMIAGAALFGGCDNPANNKVCECPNGTIHDGNKNMPCCDGEDCTCKQQFVYEDAFSTIDLVVENRTGKDVKSYVDIIKGYFNTYGNNWPGEVINLQNRGGVLTILIEPSADNVYVNDGYRSVNSTTFAISYEFLDNHKDNNIDIMVMVESGYIYTASPENAKVNIYDNGIRLASAPAREAQGCQAPFLESVLRRETTWM